MNLCAARSPSGRHALAGRHDLAGPAALAEPAAPSGWIVLAALVIALTAPTVTTPAQARIPGQTAYVLDDREAMVKAIGAIDKAIAENNTDQAADGILALLFTAGDDVTALGPELHLGLRERARALMTTLPTGAIATARTKRADEASRLLARARATRDETALWRLVAEFTFTPAAAAALERIADLAFERGDDGLAHRAFRRYLRYYRPREAYADLPWPRVLAKAGAAAAAVNDGAALDELRTAATPLASQSVPVGGETMWLGAWLGKLVPVRAATRSDRWVTFGGQASRDLRPSRPARYYRCRWVAYDLPRNDNPFDRTDEEEPDTRAYTPLQPTFPAIDGNRIYYFNGRQLGVYDLANGKMIGEHVFRSTNPADRSYMPARFRHVTVGPRHVYVTTEADPDHTNRPTQRVLHAFDRACVKGKMTRAWTRGGEKDADPVLKVTSLTGSPLRVGDTIYMAGVVRGTDDRAYVFAFAAATGKLRWRRFLCAGAGESAEPRFSRTVGADVETDAAHGETMVGASRGVVYVSTNQGVVAAIARGDGEILWLHRYPRRRRPQNPSLWPAVTPLPWQDYPLLVTDDRVVLTPRDSDRLHVLAAEPDRKQGLVRVADVRKTSPDAEMLYLIGATARRAFVTERRWVGERSIFRVVCLALGAAPDQEVWSFEIPHVRRTRTTGPYEYFTGRALLTHEFVLVPTNKHLYGLDVRTGRRIFQLAVAETMKDRRFHHFGNVSPAGVGLLCSYPDGLCWWGPSIRPPVAPKKM